MTIAEDVLAALRVLDKPSTSEELWTTGGKVHAQGSFNAMLADMTLNKRSIHRWKAPKGFLYGFPAWKGDNKYEHQIPHVLANQPIKAPIKKQSSAFIEREASKKAADILASIPAFNKITVTDQPKTPTYSLKDAVSSGAVKIAVEDIPPPPSIFPKKEPTPLPPSPLAVLTRATIAEYDKLRDKLLEEIALREELIGPIGEAIKALEKIASRDGIN